MKSNNIWSRRKFLQSSGLTAAGAMIPLNLRTSVSTHSLTSLSLTEQVQSETIREMLLAAIDTAHAMGATYAEARLTRTVAQEFWEGDIQYDSERLGISVRTLIGGGWGFAASPYCDKEEAILLTRDSIAQAKGASHRMQDPIDMGSYPAVSGSWNTPMRIDPFSMPLEEKIDYMESFEGYIPRRVENRNYGIKLIMEFTRQEQFVAISNGSYFSQTVYSTGGTFTVAVEDLVTKNNSRAYATNITPAGLGFERFLDAKLREQIHGLIDEAEYYMTLQAGPVEVGRFDTVFDASTVGSLIGTTLSQATQIDRVIGYEANASGTSYFGPDPIEYLGSKAASPLVTLHADRSLPAGLATVKWDDEGVEVEKFPIIREGVLHSYQTTRQHASTTAAWNEKQGMPVKSNGCAASESAFSPPLVMSPNIIMESANEDIGLQDLISPIKRGMCFINSLVTPDFQLRNGTISLGMPREIINGKLGAVIPDAGVLFESTQLWKSLTAIGGKNSVTSLPYDTKKGQPQQTTRYTIESVPAVFKDAAIFDVRRKA